VGKLNRSSVWGVLSAISFLIGTTLIGWSDDLHGALNGLVGGAGIVFIGLAITAGAACLGGGFKR